MPDIFLPHIKYIFRGARRYIKQLKFFFPCIGFNYHYGFSVIGPTRHGIKNIFGIWKCLDLTSSCYIKQLKGIFITDIRFNGDDCLAIR